MALEKCGIDFIDVSVGLYETGSVCVEPISFPQGWRKDLIKAVKDHVSIPVIGVSCIREPQVAESFLEGGIVDFVSMGRSWLADEQWGLKVLEGRENEICKCINCLRCFESLNAWMGAGIPAECAVNPRACRERLYGNAEYDTQEHKVVVVGGGPCGMIAAKTLAERGMKVTLVDRQSELGGTINLAKKPPFKERMGWIADYYNVEFEKLGVVLGGTGAEMAVQCGRDNGSIPKKLGSEFVIRRNNDHVTAQVCRRGTELVNIDLKIGEYNNAMTGMLYQFPEAGKKTYGGGFYFHLDREPDKEGKSHFQNGALLQNLCEYNYHSWEPGFAAIKLQSSIDDPWGELPIRTVIGGAYSSNDLMVHKLNLCEEIDADVLAPYLLTARYDRTAFMETGRR